VQKPYDVAVVGAGFGGLGAALGLAERGAHVVLFESLSYPGGCASTFRRSRRRHESGATLFSGFAPGQLFRGWIDVHQLPVRFVPLDPVIELRAPGLRLPVPPDRARLVDRLATLPGAPTGAVRAFFTEQWRVADALWELLDDPRLLPPLDLAGLLRHLGRASRYLPVLRVVGRPLLDVLHRHGVADFQPLRTYVDAISQITVQAPASEAEAPLALATLDYPLRGTGHVHGGIGELAQAMTDAVRRLGGTVRMADRVGAVKRRPWGFDIEARRGTVRAREVVLNLLPRDAAALCGVPLDDRPRLRALQREIDDAWSAAMLYLELALPDGEGCDTDFSGASAYRSPFHLQLVADVTTPFTEGNHVFLSVSGADEPDRAPVGHRTATVSTHIPLATLRALPEADRGAYFAEVQETACGALWQRSHPRSRTRSRAR
jgi:phytoene dehydrogenase-like protein